MCDFLEEIARHKLFRLISSGNRPPQTFSAHFLRKSAATKLFRLISSGNRLPQNFFGSFPQEIARHKTFSAHFLRKSAATKLFRLISSGNRPPQNFFSPFPQEIAGMGFHSFPQEIVGWPTSNSRYVKRTLYRLKRPLHSPSLSIDRQNGTTPPGRSVEKLRH